MTKRSIGCIDYKGFYAEQAEKSILRSMVMTDEYLAYLGEQFQNKRVKQEGWTFYDWIYEVIGMDLMRTSRF